MTISEIVRQGFHYVRTCRSLWLFGFFVGISGGSGGGGRTGGRVRVGGAGGSGGSGFPSLSGTEIGLIVAIVLLAIVVFTLLRFISEGALIEGIVRARQGGHLTVREGFRAGWTHWGVLFRIALIYFLATIASIAVLIAPCVLAMHAFGWIGAIVVSIPLLIIAIP